MAPLLSDVSLCVLPPKTSRVPLRSAAECKYRGKPLSLRMNLEHMHDKCVKGECDKKTCNTWCHIHRHEYIMKNESSICDVCVCVDLPSPGVNIIAIKVIYKAVFVSRQCLIASMNIHTTAGTVIRAAVAVTSLGNGTFGLRQ